MVLLGSLHELLELCLVGSEAKSVLHKSQHEISLVEERGELRAQVVFEFQTAAKFRVPLGKGLQLIFRQVVEVVPLEGDGGCLDGHAHLQVVLEDVKFDDLQFPIGTDEQLQGEVEDEDHEGPLFPVRVQSKQHPIGPDQECELAEFVQRKAPEQEVDSDYEVEGLAEGRLVAHVEEQTQQDRS